MTSKLRVQKQSQHTFVLVEVLDVAYCFLFPFVDCASAQSLICLNEFEKAEYVIESMVTRGELLYCRVYTFFSDLTIVSRPDVPLPPYLYQKYPILILTQLRRDINFAETLTAKRAVTCAVRLISQVPALSRK